MDVLLTFTGFHDPYFQGLVDEEEQPGPIFSLFSTRSFDQVFLYSISSVMGKLKSQSASSLREKLKWLGDVYWKENIVWSPGYFVSSAGIDEQTTKNYVEHQGRQDPGQLQLKL